MPAHAYFIDAVLRAYPDRLAEQVRRPMEALLDNETMDGRVHHLHYSDYMNDPIASVEGIYDWLGLDLTDLPRAAMQDWLRHDPLRVARSATWSLADFGVDEKDLAQKFDFYYDRFGMADPRLPREDFRP